MFQRSSNHRYCRIGILPAFQVFLIEARIDKGSIVLSFQESRILQHTLMERNRSLDTQNLIFAQRTGHVRNSRITITSPTTELCNHRIIMQRNLKSRISRTVQTDITSFGSFTNGYHPGRRHEVILGIFGINATFNGSSPELDIFLPVRQTVAGSYQYHVAYQIDPGTLFRHRMFHLQAGIHFQKIKILVFIHHELQRSGTVIINPLTGLHCNLQHLGTCFGLHKRRRRFFNYFLIASLNGTFPFIKMNYISIFISQYLYFDVMGILDIFFNINSIVAKRRSGFRL